MNQSAIQTRSQRAPDFRHGAKRLSANGILAQNLLLARTGANLTQQALAHASTVSRATIAQIEAGIGDPRLETIELLADALSIPPTLLLSGPQEFLALATIASAPSPQSTAAFIPSKLRTMIFLVNSGNPRHRLEAARIGVEVLRQSGLTDKSHAVGAAIGSARLPGHGTLLGARLAHLLKPGSSAIQSSNRGKNTHNAALESGEVQRGDGRTAIGRRLF